MTLRWICIADRKQRSFFGREAQPATEGYVPLSRTGRQAVL